MRKILTDTAATGNAAGRTHSNSSTAGVWGKIMNALAGAHDAAVQMFTHLLSACINTGASITRNKDSQWVGHKEG